MATLRQVVCNDCQALCPVSFALIVVRNGKGHLVSFASCTRCKSRGDKRSLHTKLELEPENIRKAVELGLPALRIA